MRSLFAKLFFAGLAMGLATSLLAEGPAKRKRDRPRIRQGDLKEGQVAPDFALQDVEGKNTVKLSDLQGKPVVLIFGSCTCPPFVASTRATEKLYDAFKDKTHFYIVYIREAHPTDGGALPRNRFQVKAPTSDEERRKVAGDFAEELKVSIPILVDSIDDPVENMYSCWPNRMYIIDAQGKIVDKGSAGPGGVAGSAQRAPEVLNRLLDEAP